MRRSRRPPWVIGQPISVAPGRAFRVDRVASLDRAAIRRSVLERFSAEAMATAYEDVYRRAAKVVPLVQRDREAAAVRDEAVATALGRGA